MQNKLLFTITLITSIYSKNLVYSQEQKTSLESFIEKKRDFNKNNKVGFSVLLYNGDEEEAIEIYNTFREDYEDIKIIRTYTSPNWKVKTKSYSTKIEAERIYLIVKEKYPYAKIL